MSTLPLHCTVVMDEPQAIWLPDGTAAILLYRVNTTAARTPQMRAMRTSTGWLVIDLYRVVTDLRYELPGADERDVNGLVLFAIRQTLPSAALFLARAYAAVDATLTRLVNKAHQQQEAAC